MALKDQDMIALKKHFKNKTKMSRMPKTNIKGQKSRTKFTKRWLLLALFLLSLARQLLSSNKHNIQFYTYSHSGTGDTIMCAYSTRNNMNALWLKAGSKIGFNTKSGPRDELFVSDNEGNKLFVMLEPGTDQDSCYMPDPEYKYYIPVFLIIEWKRNSGHCRISRIITTSHLVPCQGDPPDVSTIIKIRNGNYFGIHHRDQLDWDTSYIPRDTYMQANFDVAKPFSYDMIDDEFVEFLALRGFYYNTHDYVAAFNGGVIDKMRKGHYLTDGRILTAKSFVEKNSWDGLRGYYLDLYPEDGFPVLRVTMNYAIRSTLTSTIFVQFYIPKANLMAREEVYVVNLGTRRLKLDDPSYTLMPLNYKLKIQRQIGAKNQLDITLIRVIDSKEDGETTLSIPYTGNDEDWIHFGVSLGRAAITYSLTRKSVVFKRIEAIHAWFKDQIYHQEMTKFEDGEISSMYSGTTNGDRTQIILSIDLEAYSDAQMKTKSTKNKPGIRVWTIKGAVGSHLSYKALSSINKDNRCFLPMVISKNCLMYAFMKNREDFSQKSDIGSELKDRHDSCSMSTCGYCVNGYHCTFAGPGYNEDLYYSSNLNFIKFSYEATRFDPKNEDHKERFFRLKNNLNQEYWIRCPPACKFNPTLQRFTFS